jgi:GAF domain-containing protein
LREGRNGTVLTEVPVELLASFRALSAVLGSEETFDATLHRVATLLVEVIRGAEAVGITLVRDVDKQPRASSAETAAYSDERVKPIDEAQYATNEGPCLQAIEDNEVYGIESLADEERWPNFKQRAFQEGLRSSLSVPLAVGDRAIGALNMYAFRERAFADGDIEMATAFASQTAVNLANIKLYESAVQLSENLNEAMKSRAVIEQAKGMIMMQRHCSADDAFQTLVAASQARNKKLRAIALEVVEAASSGDGEGPLADH